MASGDHIAGADRSKTGVALDQAKRINSLTSESLVAAAATVTLLAAPAASSGLSIKILSVSVAEVGTAAGIIEFLDGASGTSLFTLGSPVNGYAQRTFAGKIALTAETLLEAVATGGGYEVHVEYVVE